MPRGVAPRTADGLTVLLARDIEGLLAPQD